MTSYNYTKVLSMDFYKNEFLEVSKANRDKKVIFYGAGEVFDIMNNIFELKNYFNIEGISDKKFENKTDRFYNDYKIIKPSELQKSDAEVILLTLAYPDKVMEFLSGQNLNKEIKPFYKKIDPILKYDVELIKKDNKKYYYHLNSYNVNLVSDDYNGIIEEVFFWQIYNIKNKFKFSDYSLYDIGMNRAYTDIYFALDERCNKTFGFEPFKGTFDFAKENVSLNPKYANKINLFNFGLSNKNYQNDVYYLPHRDGISTVNIDFIKNYAPEEMNKLQKETVNLKQASEVISDLFLKDTSKQKILKLDAEGAEYEVIPDLFESGMLKQFNIIAGDMHILNEKSETMELFDYMYKSGFKTYEMHQHQKTIDYVMYKEIEILE